MTNVDASVSRAAAPARAIGGALPDYERQQSSFHRAFEPELRQLLAELPLMPGMRVLDLPCGDGFYTRRLAERLGPAGAVTGVDTNRTYVRDARTELTGRPAGATIDVIVASFDRLPFPDEAFGFAWCAQSLYSLPDPVVVLRHLARVLRPGGILAVLENDTMHQVVLPWPARLELPLRVAELRALSAATPDPSKYYIGRRLPAVLAAAGLEPLSMSTRAIDRQAPLGEPERVLLQSYLEEVADRVAPYLDPSLFAELRHLKDPESPLHLLRQPYLTMTWLNVLALARKPAH